MEVGMDPEQELRPISTAELALFVGIFRKNPYRNRGDDRHRTRNHPSAPRGDRRLHGRAAARGSHQRDDRPRPPRRVAQVACRRLAPHPSRLRAHRPPLRRSPRGCWVEPQTRHRGGRAERARGDAHQGGRLIEQRGDAQYLRRRREGAPRLRAQGWLHPLQRRAADQAQEGPAQDRAAASLASRVAPPASRRQIQARSAPCWRSPTSARCASQSLRVSPGRRSFRARRARRSLPSSARATSRATS